MKYYEQNHIDGYYLDTVLKHKCNDNKCITIIDNDAPYCQKHIPDMNDEAPTTVPANIPIMAQTNTSILGQIKQHYQYMTDAAGATFNINNIFTHVDIHIPILNGVKKKAALGILVKHLKTLAKAHDNIDAALNAAIALKSFAPR